jgi:transaldolase
VRDAARRLRAAHDRSDERDGFVSFECTPHLADDAAATVAQGSALWQRLSQPNVMIKVPGTEAGLKAIETLWDSYARLLECCERDSLRAVSSG